MPEEKPYRLTPQPLPKGRTRRSVYADAIREFAESGERTALVEFEGRSAAAVYAGLLHILGKDEHGEVSVHRSAGRVYLTRRE